MTRLVAALFLVWLTRDISSREVSSPSASSSWVATDLIVGLLCILLLMYALSIKEAVLRETLGHHYVRSVRERLFEALYNEPVAKSRQRRVGAAISRLITDLSAVKSWISDGVARVVVAGVSLTGAVITLGLWSPQIAVAAMCLVIVGLSALVWASPAMDGMVRSARRQRGRLADHITDMLLALPTAFHSGTLAFEKKRVRRYGSKVQRACVELETLNAYIIELPRTLFPIVGIVLVVMVSVNQLTLADLPGALALSGLIATSVLDIGRAWVLRIGFVVARRRLCTLLSAEPLAFKRHSRDLPVRGPLRVCVRDATFRSLREFSFEVCAGEHLLLSSSDPAAVSDAFEMLARFDDPEVGSIRLGGIRLDEVNQRSLARRIVMVSNVLPMLRGTVRENVLYGLVHEEHPRAERAMELCGITMNMRTWDLGGPQIRDTHHLPLRIGLARALVLRPGLVMINARSSTNRRTVEQMACRVIRELDTTVLACGLKLPGLDTLRIRDGRASIRRAKEKCRSSGQERTAPTSSQALLSVVS